jgi:hypothetical protein
MTVRRPPPLVLVALMAALGAGCGHGSTATMHTGLRGVRMATYTGHGITFRYPTAWRYRHRGFFSTMTSPVVDLASQPTRDPCTMHGCWFPARHLRPGAVVVTWEQAGGLIDPAHPPKVGVHVRVLRRGCRSLGGDEEVAGQVVLRGGRVYEVEACLRAPGVAAHARDVRAMLASAGRVG